MAVACREDAVRRHESDRRKAPAGAQTRAHVPHRMQARRSEPGADLLVANLGTAPVVARLCNRPLCTPPPCIRRPKKVKGWVEQISGVRPFEQRVVRGWTGSCGVGSTAGGGVTAVLVGICAAGLGAGVVGVIVTG